MNESEPLPSDPALLDACRAAVRRGDGESGTISRPVLAALALGVLGLLLSMGLLLYGLASIRGPSLMSALARPTPLISKSASSPPAAKTAPAPTPTTPKSP
jgi:hypothetical protein